jgi:hypothetical protein
MQPMALQNRIIVGSETSHRSAISAIDICTTTLGRPITKLATRRSDGLMELSWASIVDISIKALPRTRCFGQFMCSRFFFFYMIGLQYQPINGQCCAGFVVLLHLMCKTQTKERQTTPNKGAETAVGERKRAKRKLFLFELVIWQCKTVF